MPQGENMRFNSLFTKDRHKWTVAAADHDKLVFFGIDRKREKLRLALATSDLAASGKKQNAFH